MYTDRALISDLECGTTEHYIIIKNVQRQNVIVYIIILSSSQELSQCLLSIDPIPFLGLDIVERQV